MSNIEKVEQKVAEYEAYIAQNGIDDAVINAYIESSRIALVNIRNRQRGIKISTRAKEIINQHIHDLTGGDIWMLEMHCQINGQHFHQIDQYYEILKYESYYLLESFIYHMERDRNYKKRFYQPREGTLKVVVQDLQDLEDRVIKFYGLSMPSRVGKSTICIFFLAWIAMKRPNSHSAMGGHSGILARGFYGELLNLFVTSEYSFVELYYFWHPSYKRFSYPTRKSADEYTITLGNPDRFATITCRGADGTWTGAVDVSADGYLYIDDLVRDREHSLSPIRMEKTYQDYLNTMVDRKNDGARELMVGTLWNVLDPLERMRKMYDGNPEYRFRRIPALDENGESNFAYTINGFSTEYYLEIRERLDNAEWMAKYQQQPYIREGLLFPTDELRYFNGILPEGEIRRVSVVDVAWGGGDSLSMPIGVEYENGDIYIIAWVFSGQPKEVTIPIVVGKIIENEIRQLRFEGNQGGELYQQYVGEKLDELSYKCALSSKKASNMMQKQSKIIAYSGDIKRKFVFLDSHAITREQIEKDAKLGVVRYHRDSDYQRAMDELTMFVSIGKNEHDDAADGLTQLAQFVENPKDTGTVKAVMNPFRRV